VNSDWLIVVANMLIFGGAVIVLGGVVTMSWPRPSISWNARKRAALGALMGLCIVYAGNALHDYGCDPKIPCNRCSANRLPPVSGAHACVRPVTAKARVDAQGSD
jgi:hypothetical protein